MGLYRAILDTLDMGINSLNTKSVMTRIDLTPNYLQSDFLENPIIRADQIQFIKFNLDISSIRKTDETVIKFHLIDGDNVYWAFISRDKAEQAYIKIKEQLKDIKMIV